MTPADKKIRAFPVRTGTRFEFDPGLSDLLSAAKVDRAKAWEVLALAASYMERDEKLPYQLGAHLSRAFRGALAVRRYKDLTLRKGLGLAGGNRRRIGGDAIEIGHAMIQELEDNPSVNAAAKKVGARFGVSVPTAKRRLREYREALLRLEQAQED